MGVEYSACVLQYAAKTYVSAGMYLYKHILLNYPRILYKLLPGWYLESFFENLFQKHQLDLFDLGRILNFH